MNRNDLWIQVVDNICMQVSDDVIFYIENEIDDSLKYNVLRQTNNIRTMIDIRPKVSDHIICNIFKQDMSIIRHDILNEDFV